jgi:hypothetical protein
MIGLELRIFCWHTGTSGGATGNFAKLALSVIAYLQYVLLTVVPQASQRRVDAGRQVI